MRIVENIIKSSDKVVDLLLSTDQWRKQLDNIHLISSNLGQDAVAVKEWADDELREEPLVGAL